MHSTIVGGSTAKRVLSCPGSIPLVQQVPKLPASSFAEEGTRLHELIAKRLNGEPVSGEPKISQAMALLNEFDPDHLLEFEVEQMVHFPGIDGAFGSVDLIGRMGDTAVILDWKFGDGVVVDAEENAQLMFYAAAARSEVGLQWVFAGAKQIEMVIIQPPEIRRWTTTFERLDRFERELRAAVEDAKTLRAGEHCRWCPAKVICPEVTGAAQRAVVAQLQTLNPAAVGEQLVQAQVLKGYIEDLEKLAYKMLDEGLQVPGWKMVPKQARRQWADESKAKEALLAAGLTESDVMELRSPAQVEKKLKPLPEGLAVSVSSGNTIAPEADPRPRVIDFKRHFAKLGVK
jgi:hypothetical protein